jgi:hypothetical protein
MAALATTLQEQSSNGASTTYLLPVHTALVPALVIQKRVVPSGKKIVAEDTVKVVIATSDAEGSVLESKVDMGVYVRRPINGQSTDVAAALAYLRDIVQSDEFEDRVVAKQLNIKA